MKNTRIAIYSFTTTAYLFSRLIRHGVSDVEWSVILPRGHHLAEIEELVPSERLLYLYQNFNTRYMASSDIVNQPVPAAGDPFSLSLMKDKGGYVNLDKDEQLRRVGVVYSIYKEFLLRVKPDFLLFPDVEVTDGFVLLGLCEELGISPIYHVGMRLLGGSFFAQDAVERLPKYFGEASPETRSAASTYLRQINASARIFPFPTASLPPGVIRASSSLSARVLRSLVLSLSKEKYYAGEDDFWQKVMFSLAGFVGSIRRFRFSWLQAQYFDVHFAEEGLPEKYIFYALQYTPESSINGLMPYYVDQLRAVDRLLISLPHGYRLVVKEHPGMVGVRPSSFYKTLRKRPGVVLAAPTVDSQVLIRGAALVASVTGTVGLECYLLDRPCCLFGKNFFSHLCYDAESLMTSNGWIATIIDNYRPPSFEQKVEEIAKLLSIRYEFELSDPFAMPEIMSDENVCRFAAALRDHLARLEALAVA